MISARSLKYRRSLHVAALAVVLSVFPLIWMGGMVTTKGVGMSVPDWPNSYGYNMFLFPPSRWLGGIFFEHVHRLLGSLAGFLAITLTLMAWGPATNEKTRTRIGQATVILGVLSVVSATAAVVIAYSASTDSGLAKYAPHVPVGFVSLAAIGWIAWLCRRPEPRRWVRWLTVAELGTIIIQGVLGGLRVDLKNVDFAIVHGCFAQAFFCLAAFTALATSKWWNVFVFDFRLGSADSKSLKAGLVLAFFATGVIYTQLVAGAIMRHNGAGLAIPTLPLAFGHVLPPTDSAGVDAANAIRAWTPYDMPPVTMEQMWMHFAHRAGAVCVSIAILALSGYVLIRLRRERAAVAVVAILLVLLATQLTLGVGVVWFKKPADLTSMHVAVGALTLMTASLAAGVLWRLLHRRRSGVVEAAVGPSPLMAVA